MAQDTFSELLGRVWDGSCLFRPAYTPPAQRKAAVWLMGPLNCGSGLSFFVFLPFSSCRSPPVGSRGRSGYFGYPDCGTGLHDSIFSLFSVYNFASPPLVEVVALFWFFAFPSAHSRPPPPLQVTWRWFFLTFFLTLMDRPRFFPFFLGVFGRLRSLAFQRCGSEF